MRSCVGATAVAAVAAAGTLIAATNSAETTNVAASTATIPPSPRSWTARPPSGDPTRRARLEPTAFIAFADASSSRGTSAGIRAAVAGLQTRASPDCAAATR